MLYTYIIVHTMTIGKLSVLTKADTACQY